MWEAGCDRAGDKWDVEENKLICPGCRKDMESLGYTGPGLDYHSKNGIRRYYCGGCWDIVSPILDKYARKRTRKWFSLPNILDLQLRVEEVEEYLKKELALLALGE